MPEIPVAAEAGLFRGLVGDLLREPAKAAEDAADHDLPDLVHDEPKTHPAAPSAESSTHIELRDAVANGKDTYWLTRRLLTEGGQNGKDALKILDKYKPKVEYGEGGGSFYDHSSNSVHIDLNNGDPAVGLVHESTHVQWAHEGYSSDIATTSKADYLHSTLSEETDATTRQIYENIHRQTAMPHLNLPDTALQSEFKAGYNSAAQQAEVAARAQGRVLTPNERAIAGDAGGRQAVYNEFQSGRVTNSIDGRSYVDYMGGGWDDYQNWLKNYGNTP